jgi:predicted acylesterase/phospholipase RssA
MKSDRLSRYAVVLILSIVFAGCVHSPRNKPMAAYSPGEGYRFTNTAHTTNSDELFVILAFSGGGTRAAAFSFGAMEELRDTTITWNGTERRLLEEVDLISSVSGGSFTAAYYGLYREQMFQEFPERFLYRNVTFDLGIRLFNPVNWFRLTSPYYDRIDMAAEFYDRHIFARKTFADLNSINARPFIILNATDMSLVSRFEFTQSQFDVIGSDLSSYPVARGVAASSAFPFLLSPITLQNYAKPLNYSAPQWIEDALEDRQLAPREFGFATAVKSYLETTNRPFIHLLDGGLADNLGLRGPAFAMTSVQNLWSLKNLLNTKIKHLLVITVNAKTDGPREWDKKERAPGILGVASVVSTGPMGNYSDETVQYIKDTVDAFNQEIKTSREVARLSGGAIPALRQIKYYHTEVSFQDLRDEDERRFLTSLPTTYNLSRDRIDRLRAAARKIIHDSETLKELRKDLQTQP